MMDHRTLESEDQKSTAKHRLGEAYGRLVYQEMDILVVRVAY